MKLTHRISLILTFATLALIYVGGLVTSTHSGLAVPDWPLSYGQVMPPMVGGILFEHGHRLVASLVGLLTIICAVIFTLKEERAWMKKLAWLAVGLVIFQGVLGGLTVFFRLPWFISASHATLAQTFFSLVVALAVWSSPFWRSDTIKRSEPLHLFPLHDMALSLMIVLFLQLMLGSIVRHTGHLFSLHIAGAVIIVFLASWIHFRVWQHHASLKPLRVISSALISVILFQVILGITTFILLVSRIKALSGPISSPAIVSLHVATGAAVIGLSVALFLIAFKTKPVANEKNKKKLSDYLELTKPGISFMAGITALAGFVLGSKGDIDLAKLFHTTVGTLLIAGGAGTLNMLIEKDSDARMNRTARRPIPSGRMKPGEALLIGTLLSVSSIVYLSWAVNFLTAIVAGLTLSIYLYIYTPLKKISAFCTVVGAVAGALPPVIGWAAATNGLGWGGWVLFGIVFFWQFPHFFSLAWIYRADYAKGGLHMLPVHHDQIPDARKTAWSVVINSAGLLIVSLIPSFINMTGAFYLGTAFVLGMWMMVLSIAFFKDLSNRNARKLFFLSLVYVPVLVILMVLNRIPAI